MNDKRTLPTNGNFLHLKKIYIIWMSASSAIVNCKRCDVFNSLASCASFNIPTENLFSFCYFRLVGSYYHQHIFPFQGRFPSFNSFLCWLCDIQVGSFFNIFFSLQTSLQYAFPLQSQRERPFKPKRYENIILWKEEKRCKSAEKKEKRKLFYYSMYRFFSGYVYFVWYRLKALLPPSPHNTYVTCT